VSISRPPHAEHRSFRPTSGTGVSAGHRCTSSTPSCRHLAHVATTEWTPFSRMFASVIGSIILPSPSRARRCLFFSIQPPTGFARLP
jgi:hypothetical protein